MRLHIHQKLQIACFEGKTAEAKRLIAERAPIDRQDGNGRVALHFASANGHTEIVMLLIENKCNLNVAAKNGNTPLIYAVTGNKMDNVRTLVEAGCDVTIRGEEKKTAAEWARQWGRHAIAEYLTNEERVQVHSTHCARVFL